MRDPDLVRRAERAAIALERAWGRWLVMHGLGAGPQSPVSSYVGYSLDEPWGQPRVVFGVSAEGAERLASLLDGHDCVGPIHAEMASRPEWRRTASGTSIAPPWPFDDPLGIPAQASFPAPEALGLAGQADTNTPGRGDMTSEAEGSPPHRNAGSAAASDADLPGSAGLVPGSDANGYGAVATNDPSSGVGLPAGDALAGSTAYYGAPTDEAAAFAAAPTDAVSRDAVPNGSVSRDAVPNNAAASAAAPADAASRDAVPNDAAAFAAAPADAASRDAMSDGAALRDAVSDDEVAGAAVNGSAAGSAAGQRPASSDGPLPSEPGAARDRSATATGGPGLIASGSATSMPSTQANGAARTGSAARAVAVGLEPASRLAERDDTTAGPTSAPPRSPVPGRFPAGPLLPVPVRPSAKARRRGSRRSAREAGEQDSGTTGDGDAWQPDESGATPQFAAVASPGTVAFWGPRTADRQEPSLPAREADSRQPNRPEAGPEPAGPPRPAPGLAGAGPPAASALAWPAEDVGCGPAEGLGYRGPRYRGFPPQYQSGPSIELPGNGRSHAPDEESVTADVSRQVSPLSRSRRSGPDHDASSWPGRGHAATDAVV